MGFCSWPEPHSFYSLRLSASWTFTWLSTDCPTDYGPGCWVFWLQCPFLLFFLYSSLWKPRIWSGFQDGELPGFLGSLFLTSSSASFQLSWSSYYSQHRRCGVLPPVLGSLWSLLLDPSHTLAPSFSSFSASPFLHGVGGAQPCY